jgi:hypothetical protein
MVGHCSATALKPAHSNLVAKVVNQISIERQPTGEPVHCSAEPTLGQLFDEAGRCQELDILSEVKHTLRRFK